MSNNTQNETSLKKTYLSAPETVVKLEALKHQYRLSSVGRVIDLLTETAANDETSVTEQLAQLLLLAKTILKAVDNDNDQLVALTEVINNIALAKLWPTDFVSMKVNTHPLFTAAEAEAKKKRDEKIKSAQYRLKR